MKRQRDGREVVSHINQLPGDVLRHTFSFCKGSCVNLVCKKWKDLYFQVYKNKIYNVQTFKSENLMLYLIGNNGIHENRGIESLFDFYVQENELKLFIFDMASQYSSLKIVNIFITYIKLLKRT